MDRVTLPDAAWRQRAGLAQLVDVLGAAAGETRIVGGAVRDTLPGIGLDIADFDLSTRPPPHAVPAPLPQAGRTAVPAGLAYRSNTERAASAPSQGTAILR